MCRSITEFVPRLWCRLLGALLGFGAAFAAPEPARVPVLQVDAPFPTADKPQCKLWFAEGRWWALLPRAGGPSLWERADAGWREHPEVAGALRGAPGRADVWADVDGVTAVGVADRLLAVYRLRPPAEASGRWQAEILAWLPAPASDAIETATLARDGAGRWWVAAPVQGKIYVWHSTDARQWSAPQSVAKGLEVDDIGLVAPLPDGVAVVWSDQRREAVRWRVHRTGTPLESWSDVENIAQGDATADDHLHAALAPDGTLWLATKNSVDRDGRPQLVLRRHRPGAAWTNHPYAPRSKAEAPSRPAVFATSRPDRVLLGHVVYDETGRTRDSVVFGWASPESPEVLVDVRQVIAPAGTGPRVNDITGPRRPFPVDGPWIVLASDGAGAVYETDLRTFLP